MKFKKILASLLPVFLIFVFTSCGCKHEWTEATCLNPKTCNLCGATKGETIEHSYMDANCDNPKRCRFCDATEGEVLGHTYVDGYCTRCYMKDPNFFDAEKYGFINNQGMHTWVEITEYSIGKAESNATYTEMGHYHRIYNFKDCVLKSYSRYESKATDHKNLTEHLDSVSNYTIINNDSISLKGSSLTIIERVHDDNGNLILKVMFGSSEKWFILEEQINWDKSPQIEDFENGWKIYTYYFK